MRALPNGLLGRLSIRIKLALLAGLPVIGAIVLAALVATDAKRRAASTEALGSIEDLAQLAAQMNAALEMLQRERARVAMREGVGAADRLDLDARLAADYRATDEALERLDRFLRARDTNKLPPRLAADLATAAEAMRDVRAFRERAARDAVPVDDVIAFYERPDEALIHAMTRLGQLSDDGELLRNITTLAALAELSERVSAEHALLSYVFAAGQFPPGAYKMAVTLSTEQGVYAEAFRANARDEQLRAFDEQQRSPEVQRALVLRAAALSATDDAVVGDVEVWDAAEDKRLAKQHEIAQVLLDRISAAATAKVDATRTSIRVSVGLSAFVVVASALLAWVIARRVTRSISDLAKAAARVRETRDFGIRAQATSNDELGLLTEAFNEMLGDIQRRDADLREHRENLEATVASRTNELAVRNEALRLVLDNVEQGLVMVRADGVIEGERSLALEATFGPAASGVRLADYLAPDDPRLRAMIELSWEMILEDALPLEVAVDQLPKQIVRGGRYFMLGYRPVVREGEFDGALLVVTDVTVETEARREEERQRELFAVFERVVQDRDGFAEFVEEANALFEKIAGADDPRALLTLVHTLKGTAAQWGVSSVSSVAHELESQLVDSGRAPSEAQLARMTEAWRALLGRALPLLDESEGRMSVSVVEIDEILATVRSRAPYEMVARQIERMKHEPASVRFRRMEQEIVRLARRLGKPKPNVVIEPNGVRLPIHLFGAFWTATVHVIRNSIDHGIEAAEQRLACGKPAEGTITLSAHATADAFVIELADDGRGIDWEAVAAKARAQGLGARTRVELERAIFAAGVTTAREVTEVSGRGVGLAAVAESVEALGGRIRVDSVEGRGTRFVFTFPRSSVEAMTLASVLRRAS